MPYRLLVCLLTVISLGGPLQAASITLRGDNLQRRLLADASDGTLDEFDLVSAALIAGGVDNERDLWRYHQQYKQRCSTPLPSAASPRELSRACLERLHRDLLTGRYHVEYTEISRVLDEGHYNCVTATVLYYQLCGEVHLAPQIMATREHVFIRITEVSEWDIETTCANWLDPAISEPQPVVRARTGSVRKISPVALLGKIYYNRAVQWLAEQRFQDAIELLQISIDLDPGDQPAHENLLAAINNWSLALSREGRFERPLELLSWGRELDPDYGPFAANDLHIHQKWVMDLCRRKEFETAIVVLSAGFARRPEAAVFDEGRLAVYRLWSEHLFASAQHEEAWQVLTAGRSQFANDARWATHESAALAAFVQSIDTTTAREEVRSQLQRGLSLHPESPLLNEAWNDLTASRP